SASQYYIIYLLLYQAEDCIRLFLVTGVQTCALPIYQGWVQIIWVQADHEQRMDPNDILSLYARNNQGQMVPLSAFVSLDWNQAPDRKSVVTGQSGKLRRRRLDTNNIIRTLKITRLYT